MERLRKLLRALAVLFAPLAIKLNPPRSLKNIHTGLKAYFVKRYRTNEVIKVFQIAHAEELTKAPLETWPLIKARHDREIDAIRAGKLDITDRKSWMWPFMPASINRLAVPLLKASPYNLRRMSRTPVPRRAINLIKNAVTAQPWAIRPLEDVEPLDSEDDQKDRMRIATKVFKHPNNSDSFQSYLEQSIDDMCMGGSLVTEMRLTPDPMRPLKMWPVMPESIRIFPSWTEATPDMPRYAQMTGLKGERGAILFYDDELLYLKDNPSSDTPFGLGKMEVAFQSLNHFLGVQEMAGRAGTDQVHKCFPEGTEVLTRRGWVQWRDTIENDEFATRSIEGQFQWQKRLAFVKEWHDGDLIRFRSQNLSITVTPNHRMYGTRLYKDWKTNKRISKPLGFVEATDLYDAVTNRPGKGRHKGKTRGQDNRALADFRIPTTTEWKDGTLPSPTFSLGTREFSWEDWAAFLGIWIAEGSVLDAWQLAPRKGDYRIQIAQSKKSNRAKYAKIERLLKRMGLDYKLRSDRFLLTDRDIWSYLSPLGDSHTKCIPQWIKDAPVAIIRTFVDWAMMGDGSVRRSNNGQKRKRIYYTASERLAGEMQELFQKIGSSAAVTGYDKRRSGLFAVEEMLRSEISIVPSFARGKVRMPEKIPYSGYVYCAMVPNGTLYCRENGHAFWTGNTWLWWEQPQTDSAYQIVRRHIQNELEGQAKVSLIGGMKKPDVIEVKPVLEQDLLLNWQEMLIRMIANAFDMSALALGIEHDINRAVGQVLDDKDFRSAVVPMAKRLMEGFTRRVLHAKLGWTDLEFAFLDLDDPDAETKSQLYARQYSANALTPNEWRKGMRQQPLKTPFADLTQFECMLINIEAQAQEAERAAQNNFNRQMAMTQMMAPPQEEPPPEEQPPPTNKPGKKTPPAKQGPPPQQQGPLPQKGAGGAPVGPKMTPGSMARGGQPPSPKALGLPKFPIAGSIYTAKQIAMMPVNKLADVFYSSGMSPSFVYAEMENQEPGILEVMDEEVREFFEEAIKREKDTKPRDIPKSLLDQWKKDLVKKIRIDDKRTNDFAQWLRTKAYRNASGKPGTGTGPGFGWNPRAGKPGSINPIRRG